MADIAQLKAMLVFLLHLDGCQRFITEVILSASTIYKIDPAARS